MIHDLIAPSANNDVAIAEKRPLVVRTYDEGDAAAWDDFVLRHPDGTAFHLLAWKRTIEQSFGFPAEYLVAVENRVIRGVLPLFFVKNVVVGKVLLSSPFAVYGGILAEDEVVRTHIHAHLMNLAEQLDVDRIELRNSVQQQCVTVPNVDRYVAFTQYLTTDETELLNSLPKKTRNVVRKSLKQAFEIRYGAELPYFEDLYARNMRRLGTPCFPPSYFANLVRNFGHMVDVREVWLDGQVLAASLNFLFRGDMHIYYAASDVKHNALGPNTFMYFDHLRWGGKNGFTTFDFGRCKRGTGVFEFKRHWNTVMRELPYEIIPVRCKSIPNFSPTNPRFGFLIRLWSRIPLWLTRLLGPRVIRLFP